MLEGILFGMAGGAAALVAGRAYRLCQAECDAASAASPPNRAGSSILRSCWNGAAESARQLFAECHAELEATRVAIEEVRHPASGKVVRIY